MIADVTLQHIESLHAEPEDQLYSEQEKAQASTSKEEEAGQYAECPIEGCGEMLLIDEIDYHLELHDQEVVDMDPAGQDHAGKQEQQQQRQNEAEGTRSGPSSSRRRSSTGPASQKENHRASSSSKQQTAISAWKNILNMPSSRRLTDAEKRAAATAVPGKRLGVSSPILVSYQTWILTLSSAEDPSRQVRARRAYARLAHTPAPKTRTGRPAR